MCHYPPAVRLRLEPHPSSVRRARRFLREHRCPEHDAAVIETAALLVSELVTNTVRYGLPPVELEIGCDASHALQVRVSDAAPELPRPTEASPDDEQGRGLSIVQILSDAWGVDPHQDGKTVWFRLAPPAG